MKDITPENSIKLNKKTSSNVEDVFNGITFNSNVEKEFLTYFKNLILKYKENRTGSHNDTDKVDIEFLRQIQPKIQTQLKTYIDNIGKNFNLDQLIKKSFEESNVSDNIRTELTTLVIQSVKKIVKTKLLKEAKSNISISSIVSKMDNLKTLSLTETQTKNIINNIFSSNNQNIISMVGNLETARNKYRDLIVDTIYKKILNPIENENYNKPKKERELYGNKPFKIDVFTYKKSNILVEKLISSIQNTMADRISDFVLGIANAVTFIPRKIVSGVEYAAKHVFETFAKIGRMTGILSKIVFYPIDLSLRFIKRAFGFIGNVFIKPLYNLLTFSISGVINLTKYILKNVLTIFRKPSFQKILLTPIGMYSLGFFLGFVWIKLKKLMSKIGWVALLEDIGNILPVLQNIYKTIIENAGETFSKLRQEFDKFREDHKEFLDKSEKVFMDIGEFITSLFSKDKKISDTKLGQDIIIGIEKMKTKWWYKSLKWLGEVGKSVFEAIQNHPLISSILFGGAELYILLREIKFIGPFVPGEISMWRSLIGGAIGSGVEYVTTSIFEGLFRAYTDDNMEFVFTKRERMTGLYYDFKYDKKFEGIDQSHMQKYMILKDYIDSEYDILNKISLDFKLIDNLKQNGQLSEAISGSFFKNLDLLMIKLTNSRFAPVPIELIKEIQTLKNLPEGTQKERKRKFDMQFGLAQRILLHRQEILNNTIDQMNHFRQDKLNEGLDSLVNKDGQINWKNANVILDKSEKEAERSWFDKFLISFAKAPKTIHGSNPDIADSSLRDDFSKTELQQLAYSDYQSYENGAQISDSKLRKNLESSASNFSMFENGGILQKGEFKMLVRRANRDQLRKLRELNDEISGSKKEPQELRRLKEQEIKNIRDAIRQSRIEQNKRLVSNAIDSFKEEGEKLKEETQELKDSNDKNINQIKNENNGEIPSDLMSKLRETNWKENR